MKNLWFLLLLLGIFFGINPTANANELVKNYPARGIRKIDASQIFTINVTKGKTDGVRLVFKGGSAKYEKYVKVETQSGKLSLSIENNNVRNKSHMDGIEVYLSMETIEEIELSGVCILNTRAEDVYNPRDLKIELSGVSKASINANCLNMEVELSGHSALTYCGNATYIDCELSGTSVANIKSGASAEVKFEASGVSSINYTTAATLDYLFVEESGSCSINLKGKAEKAKYDISGASSLNAKNLIAEEVMVEVSGVSKAVVFAAQHLEWSASGMANVTYYGSPKRIISLGKKGLIKGK